MIGVEQDHDWAWDFFLARRSSAKRGSRRHWRCRQRAPTRFRSASFHRPRNFVLRSSAQISRRSLVIDCSVRALRNHVMIAVPIRCQPVRL